MRVREYGTGAGGPIAVVLHGGPGAPGYMAPLALRLAGDFRVVEPFERRSGGEPLTVAGHVRDLFELIGSRCGGTRPALVGHSWGAMLALAYAAAHPETVRALALIACGTFDPSARARMHATVEERIDRELRSRLDRLAEDCADPDERFGKMGALLLPVYSYDLASTDLPIEAPDARGYEETWADMMRLERSGVYPDAFRAIEAPALMLHGAADPHPGQMIRARLEPLLPRLTYREWDRCGHYPWLERFVRDDFYHCLRSWLRARFDAGMPPGG